MSQINLDIPEVSIREVRLGSITGFQGSAGELVKNSRCGLRDKNRSFSQCLGCSVSQAACMVILVQDAAVISHGPVGCSSCYHEYAFTYRVNSPLREVEQPGLRRIFSTNLQETDTVYGGEAKLAAGIREVYERTHPHAVFVLKATLQDIGDGLEAPVRVLGKAGSIIGSIGAVDLVEHEERVKVVHVLPPQDPHQMYARAVRRPPSRDDSRYGTPLRNSNPSLLLPYDTIKT